MNTRQSIDESTGPHSLSATFNHDNSCFSVGLDTGFCGKRCPSQGRLACIMCYGARANHTYRAVYNANPCELKVSRGEKLIPSQIGTYNTKPLTDSLVLRSIRLQRRDRGSGNAWPVKLLGYSWGWKEPQVSTEQGNHPFQYSVSNQNLMNTIS